MFKSDSLAALAPALVKAQQKMGAALKDSKNPFFKSKYADLNSIIDAAIPALNEEGIAVLQSPGLNNDGGSIINTILLHTSGEFIAGQSKVVAAKQNDPQSEGSAVTYARRYGLQAMVTLKAEDDDGEGAMGRKPTVETKATNAVVTAKTTVSQTNAVVTKDTTVVTTPAVDVTAKPKPEQVAPAAKKSGFAGIRNQVKEKANTSKGDLY